MQGVGRFHVQQVVTSRVLADRTVFLVVVAPVIPKQPAYLRAIAWIVLLVNSPLQDRPIAVIVLLDRTLLLGLLLVLHVNLEHSLVQRQVHALFVLLEKSHLLKGPLFALIVQVDHTLKVMGSLNALHVILDFTLVKVPLHALYVVPHCVLKVQT
jgi:hypothetical protein